MTVPIMPCYPRQSVRGFCRAEMVSKSGDGQVGKSGEIGASFPNALQRLSAISDEGA